MRPLLAEPPLCGLADLRRLTLDDVADLHELLDLREALSAKSQEAAEKEARRPRR